MWFREFTGCGAGICVCFDPVFLFHCLSLPRGDFLVRSGGLGISSVIPSRGVGLIMRGFGSSF